MLMVVYDNIHFQQVNGKLIDIRATVPLNNIAVIRD